MEHNILNKHQFQTASKEIEVYPSVMPGRPIVYLNTYDLSES